MLLKLAAMNLERVFVYHQQYRVLVPGLGFVDNMGENFHWVPEFGLTFGKEECA